MQNMQAAPYPLRRELPAMVRRYPHFIHHIRMPSNMNLYSRNCTKHNCRCDYQDLTEAQSNSPTVGRGPDLLMTPEIEMEIDNWHRTGVPPYPELMQCPQMGWSSLSRSDLRLVHHIVGLSINLHRRGLSNCTVWAQKMPK